MLQVLFAEKKTCFTLFRTETSTSAHEELHPHQTLEKRKGHLLELIKLLLAQNKIFVLFKICLLIRVLQEFMRLVGSSENQHNAKGCFILKPNFVLARLEAFIVTAVGSFCDDGRVMLEKTVKRCTMNPSVLFL